MTLCVTFLGLPLTLTYVPLPQAALGLALRVAPPQMGLLDGQAALGLARRVAPPQMGLFDGLAAAFENEDMTPKARPAPPAASIDAATLAGLTIRCALSVTGVSTAADPSSDLYGARVSVRAAETLKSVDTDVDLALAAAGAAMVTESEVTRAQPAAQWWLDGDTLQVELATHGFELFTNWRTDTGKIESLGSSSRKVPEGKIYLKGKLERFGTDVTVAAGEVLIRVEKGRFNSFFQKAGRWSGRGCIGRPSTSEAECDVN